MVMCEGCKNHYHPECLAEHFEGDVEDYTPENIPKKWCCNIDNECQHLRKNEFVKQYYLSNNYE